MTFGWYYDLWWDGRVLVEMMKDPEAKVREGSTKAFGIASNDPNFRKAVLKVSR